MTIMALIIDDTSSADEVAVSICHQSKLELLTQFPALINVKFFYLDD